jgi:hypothetical protein
MQEQQSGKAQPKTGGAVENPYSERYKMVTTPDVVTYWNPDYSKKLSTEEAEADSKAIAVLPDKTSMPYADYKNLAGKVVNKYYTSKAGPSPTATTPAPQADVGADKTLAPGYGVKGVRMQAPDGTISTVDPDKVEYYKGKGAVVIP